MWACEKSHIAVVDSLLECGAYVDAVDVCTKTTGYRGMLYHSRADLEFMSLLLLCSSVMNGQASSCPAGEVTWRS